MLLLALLISCANVDTADAAPTTPLYAQKAGIMRVEFDDAVCFCAVPTWPSPAIQCAASHAAVSCIAKPAAP